MPNNLAAVTWLNATSRPFIAVASSRAAVATLADGLVDRTPWCGRTRSWERSRPRVTPASNASRTLKLADKPSGRGVGLMPRP